MSRQGWEDSEFPILCETCLGDNPYVRMTKEKYGKECKTCGRPFTVFKWCPGKGMRYKKTELCQTCAKIKNVCQTCVLDLEFSLPVQVRDTVLNIKDDVPRSDVNKEWFVANVEEKLGNDSLTNYGKADSSAREMLKKMARTSPYYKRNRPHICSFFVKGNCNRGSECPYRHEMPVENELSHQNIKDRYYGTNDPVARKLLNKEKGFNVPPPDDISITTLWIGGVTDDITESDLRFAFHPFGEIASVSIIHRSTCAFVRFVSRKSAEKAIEHLYNNLTIRETNLRVQWGKPKSQPTPADENAQRASVLAQLTAYGDGDSDEEEIELDHILNLPAAPPPPGAGSKPTYQSMDPNRLGTRGMNLTKEESSFGIA